jgi:hypothetical protein
VATTCSICGETLQSDGAAGLHELVAHLNPQPPPPPPPPPGPGATRRPWQTADSPPGRSRRKAKVGSRLALAGMILGVGFGRMAVAELFDRDRSSVPAQEVAAGQDVVGTGSTRAGFRTLSKPDRGFSIGLPETMDELPMTPETLDESVALLESLNPTLANVMKGNDALLDQVRLFAIDRDTGTTQLIQRIKAGRGVDVGDIPRGTFSGEYRKYGASSADEAMVRLPAGKAVLVSAQLPMGTSTVSVTQYVLAGNGHVWILTTSGDNSAKDGADIASTFRFA